MNNKKIVIEALNADELEQAIYMLDAGLSVIDSTLKDAGDMTVETREGFEYVREKALSVTFKLREAAINAGMTIDAPLVDEGDQYEFLSYDDGE